MSWFWGKKDASKDAVGQLDPSLSEYLKTETQHKPQPAVEPTPKPIPERPVVKERVVPEASLFQDGRYAHLWKNYKPIEEIDAAGKSDNEKIADVVQERKNRQGATKDAASENCSDFWLAQSACYNAPGGWRSRFTACRKETKALSRCHDVQIKFLTALGYASVSDRTEDRLDAIQVQADDMFRNMLKQEEAIEEAKEQGKPIPVFPSVLSMSRSDASAWAGLPLDRFTDDEMPDVRESQKKAYAEHIAKLEGTEKELAVANIRNAVADARRVQQDLAAVYKEESENRHRREQEGKATLGDGIKKLAGWR